MAVCQPFFIHGEMSGGGVGGGGGGGASSNLKKRTLTYLGPALVFAVGINVPKFLEFQNGVDVNPE